MRFAERSALTIVLPVVNTQQRFLLGIYIEIIAVFTLILRCIFSRDFTRSSFRHNNFNDLKLLGQIFYVDDVPINCAIKSASVEFHIVPVIFITSVDLYTGRTLLNCDDKKSHS